MKLDPEHQSALASSATVARATALFTAKPLEDFLRDDKARSASVVPKLIEMIIETKPQEEKETSTKMLGNFLRRMEVEQQAYIEFNKLTTTPTLLAALKLSQEEPQKYITKHIEHLKKEAEDSLYGKNQFFSNGREKPT